MSHQFTRSPTPSAGRALFTTGVHPASLTILFLDCGAQHMFVVPAMTLPQQ